MKLFKSKNGSKMKIKHFLDQSPLWPLLDLGPRLKRALEKVGLSPLESYVLLALLFERSRPVTPSEIAELFGLARPRLSQTLTLLEEKKLLLRKIQEEDARKTMLQLTPAGIKLANQVGKFYDQFQKKLEKALGDKTLQEGLKFLQAIDHFIKESSP